MGAVQRQRCVQWKGEQCGERGVRAAGQGARVWVGGVLWVLWCGANRVVWCSVVWNARRGLVRCGTGGCGTGGRGTGEGCNRWVWNGGCIPSGQLE
eukprot:365549-Chlamydomonas_euryale.AAC.2